MDLTGWPLTGARGLYARERMLIPRVAGAVSAGTATDIPERGQPLGYPGDGVRSWSAQFAYVAAPVTAMSPVRNSSAR